MERKLPVIETATGAFGFGFQNIFTVLRLAWLPLVLWVLLYSAYFYVLGGGAFDFSVLMGEEPAVGLAAYSALELVTVVIEMFLFAAFTLAVIRMAALGEDAPGGVAYLRVGGNEVRYVLGILLYILLFLIFTALAFAPLVGVVIYSETEAGDAAWTIPAMVAAGAFGFVAFTWFLCRTATFVPVIAAERRLAFFYAFGMTAGNFWRIVGASLMFVVVSVFVALLFAFGVVLLVVAINFTVGMDALQTAVEQIQFASWMVAPLVGAVIICLMMMLVFTGAYLGFGGLIYKHLADDEASDARDA
ncbi:MAG: hypothetical protein AAGC95_17420 [Pseudomonadota bacterium]